MTSPLPDRSLTVGVGLYTGQQQDPSAPLYQDAVPLAVAAEAAGFDAFWVSEHHGFADAYLPSPLTLLAAIAARTSRIALGTGVAVAPLAHPLRLAEEAAVVDQLSNGRLLLGLGIGYAEHEYRAFGVERSARGAALTDLVRLLRKAWGGETFDWDGPCYRGQGVRVTPRPVREGGIPIWLGGYADAAVRRAARIADGYLLGRADPTIVESVDGLLRTSRHPAAVGFTFAVNVIAVLTDDPSARAGLAYQQAAYEAIQQGGIAHAGPVSVAAEPISPETVTSYVHVHGSAEQVAEQLAEIAAGLAEVASSASVIRALFPEPDVSG